MAIVSAFVTFATLLNVAVSGMLALHLPVFPSAYPVPVSAHAVR